MADRNKFEEMLERLVNEDKAGAEELFHEIVVEKSRDIYEGLLESDLEDEVDEATDEEVDETKDEEVDETKDEEVDETKDEEVEEEFDLDEFEVAEEDPTDDMMKDMEAGDDMDMDMDMDDEGGDSDEDIEDRVVDLEDALDDLKAEFEKMMSDEDGDEGDDEAEDDMDMDDEGEDDAEEESFELEATDDEVEEASDEEVEESPKSEAEQMREYVEKVNVSHSDTADNKKSPVAGKNDMGGTASNIASGSSDEKGRPAPTTKEDNAGNINTPGAKAAKGGGKAPAATTAEKGADSKPVIGG